VEISEKYPELFHYTSESGLRGIIETQTIRATHYSCLNDSQEMLCFEKTLNRYCSKVVTKIVNETPKIKAILSIRHPAGDGAEIITKLSAEMLRMAFLEERSEEPYIASFCSAKDEYEKDNGLLSQWKGYGSGGGYALVFNTKELEELVQQERKMFLGAVEDSSVLEMRQVVYSDEEAYKEFPEDIEVLKEFVCWMTENWFKKPDQESSFDKADIENMYYKYLPSFRRCMPRCKHQGFKEEKEIRIVATIFNEKYYKDTPYTRNEIKSYIDPISNKEKRYIELFSDPNHLKRIKTSNILPIEKVIVGPSIDKEKRAERIKEFLTETEIEVTVSETPFV